MIDSLEVQVLFTTAEPPDADPHVRSRGRGERATVPPMPILAVANSAKSIMNSWTGIRQEPVAIRRIAENCNRLENRKRTGFL
jgi:hypothetical protein